MPYVDPQTVHNPTTGAVIPASWGDIVRDDLEFLADPAAFAGYNIAVPVATATSQAMPIGSEFFDNASMHSTSTNNTRITVPYDGRYEFTATVRFDPSSTGVRRGAFRVNGSTIYESMQVPAVSTLRSVVITCNRKIVLSATDYVELLTEHTAGADLAVEVLEYGCRFITR